MTRLKKVKVEKKKEVSKTVVKRLRKLGVGTHEVEIISAELVKRKEGLVKIVLQSTKDGRKGVFVIPIDGFTMDNLLDVIYGEFDEEEICLEELIGNKVIAVIVRNGKFLNIDYFETLDVDDENESVEVIDEDELDIGLEELYDEDEIDLDLDLD
ncbi:TPA: hypothetical protein ACG3RH_002930 [Clostridioides difficile]